MCDILTMECRGCGLEIETHIGDFSAGRGQITVYCPRCSDKAMAHLTGRLRMFVEVASLLGPEHECWTIGDCDKSGTHIVFADAHHHVHRDGAKVEGAILYIVDWPRGIHTNT